MAQPVRRPQSRRRETPQGTCRGKPLVPGRRRAAAAHLITVLQVSERMAYRLVGLTRSAFRRTLTHEAATDPDDALRQWLRDYAKQHPRWGYRRAYHDARGEGWVVNHKKIQRLWREERLQAPQRHRRKRVGSSTVDAPAACAPNVVWAVDFQFDVDEKGRAIKIYSIRKMNTPVSAWETSWNARSPRSISPPT